jgi:sigma-B regulation protein RsbU (phosphoserine phosphatase)
MSDNLSTCAFPASHGVPLIILVHRSVAGDPHGTRPKRISSFGDTAHGSKNQLRRVPKSVLPTVARQGGGIADGKLAWEINSARDIQRHSLPGPLDLGAGLTIAGANLPATHLSGDIYDFVRYRRRVYFLLCDVSGKGLGSALIATHLGRVFRVGARRGWSLEAMDQELHETAMEADGCEKYATGILGALDLDDRRLQLLAAGHEAPSVTGTDYGKPLTDSTGLVHCWGSPLDVRLPPPVVSFPFRPGCSLLFYTDGVSDRWDTDEDGGTRFGRRRVTAAHAEFANDAAKELCDHILSEALGFGQSMASPRDDMTVLALHWRG